MSRPNCDFNENFPLLKTEYDKWMKNKHIRKNIIDPDEVFYGLIQSEFKMPLEILKFNKSFTKGDVRGLRDRLQNISDAAEGGYLGSKFASMFYTPESFARKDPIIGKLLDSYIHTSHHYRGHDQKSKRRQDSLNQFLRNEMKTLDLLDNSVVRIGKKITKQNASQKLAKLEEEMKVLGVEAQNGNREAERQFRVLQKKEQELFADTELAVYAQFIGYIEKGLPQLINSKIARAIEARKEAQKLHPNDRSKWPNVPEWKPPSKKEGKPFLSLEDLGRLKDKDGNVISGNMRSGIMEYQKITDELYRSLHNGIDAYIETVMLGQTGKTQTQLKEFAKSLKEKLMPDYEKGFFPHFSRDLNIDVMDGLMGKLEDLALSSHKYLQSPMTIDEAVTNIQGYVSKHTKKRSDVDPESMKYSLDFPAVLAQYSENVHRFNYINTVNKNTREVMNQLEKTYKSGKFSSGYGESVTEFLMDLHKAATGYHQIKNPQTSAWIRTFLGMEFISKIGLNPRSAVRNFSQSLLNVVHWGPIAINQARKFYQDRDLSKDVDKDLEDLGILFVEAPELEESIGKHPGNYTTVRYNKESNKLEHVPITMIEKGLNLVSKGARISGVMHAKVENKNRKWTYKLAYAEMHRWLESPEFDQMVKESYEGPPPKKGFNEIIRAKREQYSKEYAVNMTVGLHFDYSKFSKSKAMREGAGAMMLQFQHFGFKFFERNMEYGRKFKNDILEKEIFGTNAWRVYRMGLIYFAAPIFAASLTGIDISSIIQHDTADRLKDLTAAVMGDEEDRKKAFHGKGPIVGNIGFPIYSDLVNIGMMMNIINLDDDNLMVLLAGLQDTYDLKGDMSSYQQLRLINTALARGIYRHLPQLKEGNIGWVLQSELGMWPTKEAKKKQKFLKKLTPDVFNVLDDLEKMGR